MRKVHRSAGQLTYLVENEFAVKVSRYYWRSQGRLSHLIFLLRTIKACNIACCARRDNTTTSMLDVMSSLGIVLH